MIRHVILRALSKLLIPLIMLFALYVQFHGDYGPGGGFQAGVIFGAAIILYALMFGLETAQRVFPPRVLEFLVAFGLLLYGSVGIDAIFLGGNFLDYGALAHDAHHGQHEHDDEERNYRMRHQYYCLNGFHLLYNPAAAVAMARKSSTLSDAPPISPPSISA